MWLTRCPSCRRPVGLVTGSRRSRCATCSTTSLRLPPFRTSSTEPSTSVPATS
uniref:zinc finger domain-containing protein n=1 Tax=Paenarthrobacter ureafaciens TaxID=37931 RepID=UPI003742D14D